MKLFHSPASPFVRKVMLVLHETGQVGDVELVSATGSPVDPASMPVTHNPLGKLPTLLLDDGTPLFDSRVICRFLDDRAGGKLYPTGADLWKVLTLEALGDGIMDAAVLIVYETRTRPEAIRHQPWVDGQWAKIDRALDVVEKDWMVHLEGPVDMGQLTLAAALGYLDFRHGARDWRNGRAALAGWAKAIASRPSLAATVPVA